MRRLLATSSLAAPSLAICAASALLSLTACSGDLERTFGLTRDAPDEFTALVPEAALTNNAGPDSAGQQALVSQAGPPAPADIREKINAEQQLDAPHRGLTERLMFWKKAPEPGTPLDPAAESQRLRENAALGQAPTVGQTPIIQDKKPSGGWLGIF